MGETFYRVHWNWGTVPFDAEHAYSYSIGPEGGKTGTEQCTDCWGDDSDCERCEGTGRVDAERGYSCCTSPEDLIASAAQMAWESNGQLGDARVVVFAGDTVGYGCDGEPLVIPSEVIEVMTWADLVARAGAEAL